MRTLLIAASLFACAPKASGGTVAAGPVEEGQAVAVFAGGCFWCIEADFDKVDGVISTTSGYTGGKEESPTYEDVGYHRTTHYEALRIVYDPDKVTYDALLDYFFRHVDPTQDNGQFCDIGKQYRRPLLRRCFHPLCRYEPRGVVRHSPCRGVKGSPG